MATLNVALSYNHDNLMIKRKDDSVVVEKEEISILNHVKEEFTYMFTEMCVYGHKVSNNFSAKLHCYVYKD